MGDCEGIGTRVTLGRELGDSARDEDSSCDSLLAEFSRVALELVDNSLEVDLTDPQLLSLLTGDLLTTVVVAPLRPVLAASAISASIASS